MAALHLTLLPRPPELAIRGRTFHDEVMAKASSSSKWYLHFELGTQEFKRGHYEAALAAYQRAREMEPLKPQVLANIGFVYQALGKTAEAEDHYKQCLVLDANFHDAWLNFGVCRLEQGDLPTALGLFEQALVAMPASIEATRAKGQCLAQMNRVPEAVECFQTCLKMAPDFAEAKIDMAILHFHLGQKMEAKTQLEAALRLDPENQRALAFVAAIG